MEKHPLIEVAGARVTMQDIRALDGLDLTVYKGEHIAIRGGNGAGKSTLLRLLRGEQWPDLSAHARIVWHTDNGEETSPLAGRSMVALVAPAQQELIISQGWEINGEDLVLGGITDAVYVSRHATDEERALIHSLASDLDSEQLLSRRVPELSQGELRRLLIARALIRRPSVLLLDEVTDGLDAESRERLTDTLRRAAQRTTLIISTHRPQTLPSWMRREICMKKGKIVSDRMLPAQGDPIGVSSHAGTPHMEAVHSDLPASARIVIKNATVFVNRHEVLHNIDWTIKPGQNWLVRGENGAGKSTLMRLIAGDEFPAAGGSISRCLARQGGDTVMLADIKKGVRMVSDLSQATYTYDVSGEELVLSGLDNSVGIYRTVSDSEHAEAARALALLGVEHLAHRSIRHCSTGEMRRLLIARAIIGTPDLILFDEPTSGLDPGSRTHVFAIMEELARQKVQLVLVTHRTDETLPSLTHELVIADGRTVYCGPYRNTVQ